MTNKSRILTSMGLACMLAAAGSAQAQSTNYFNAVVALNPAAYWTLQETNTPPAYSNQVTNYGTFGTTYNGIMPCGSGGVATAPGPLGGAGDLAAVFNGVYETGGDVSAITMGTANQWSPAPPFAVEFWINSYDPTGKVCYTAQYYCPISDFAWVGGGSRVGWLLYLNGPNSADAMELRTFNGTGSTATYNPIFGSPLVAGVWNHVAISFDANTNVSVFYNGALVGSKALTGSQFLTNNGCYSAGAYNTCCGLTAGVRSDELYYGDFTGAFAEVAYYTNVLPAATVASHYAARTSAATYTSLVMASNPIIYWQMDQNASPVVATNYGTLGAAANAYYDGSLQPGTVTGPPYGGFPANAVACVFGGLSGSQSSLSTGPSLECAPGNPNLFSFPSVALVAWIQVNSPQSANQTVLGRGTNSYKLWLDTSGCPHFQNGLANTLVCTNVVTDGNWHMLAATYNSSGGAAALYIDGTNEASATFGAVTPPFYKVMLVGGDSDNHDDQLVGNMAHVTIFSNALSAGQIATLYAIANPPSINPPPQLVQPVFPVSGVTPNFWTSSTYVFRPIVQDPAPGANLIYSWKTNNVIVSKATNSYLAFSSLANLVVGTTYTLQMVATDANGTTNSSVSFKVVAPPATGVTLYNDSFTRVGLLNGTLPDVVDLFGTSWLADWTFSDNGSQAASASLGAGAASLPFRPETGHVYVLSCDMNEGGGTNWAALGFSSLDSAVFDPVNNASDYGPYLLALGNHAAANSAQMYYNYDSSVNNYSYDTSGLSTYQVVLNTTQEPWQVSFAQDGVVQNPATSVGTDPTIYSVFIANYETGNAVFDNFKLTDSVGVAGGAHIEGEPASQLFALSTFPAVMGVAAVGTPTLNYQWMLNNNNLADNGRIVGSHSNILTILAATPSDAGTYTVLVHNTAGSDTSSGCLLTVGDSQLSLDITNIQAWTPNMNSAVWSITSPIGNPIGSTGVTGLELTDGTGDECSSAWFPIPQYIGGFQAAFTYTPYLAAGLGETMGTGAAFVLQNDPRGTAAIGSTGGTSSGIEGNPNISPSVALVFQTYASIGVGWAVDGAVSSIFTPGSIILTSDDPLEVSMTYEGAWLNLSIQDTNASPALAFYTNMYVGNITSELGANTAFVGFTGADLNEVSIQTISNFTFTSIPLNISQGSANNVLISWPESYAGYALQQNTDLQTTNWVNVSTTSATLDTNELYQLSVPAINGPVYYRLMAQ
jgi:hypothetical protein